MRRVHSALRGGSAAAAAARSSTARVTTAVVQRSFSIEPANPKFVVQWALLPSRLRLPGMTAKACYTGARLGTGEATVLSSEKPQAEVRNSFSTRAPPPSTIHGVVGSRTAPPRVPEAARQRAVKKAELIVPQVCFAIGAVEIPMRRATATIRTSARGSSGGIEPGPDGAMQAPPESVVQGCAGTS